MVNGIEHDDLLDPSQERWGQFVFLLFITAKNLFPHELSQSILVDILQIPMV